MAYPRPEQFPLVQLALTQVNISPKHATGGVYVIRDGDRPLFIGESHDIYQRVAQHMEQMFSVIGDHYLASREMPQPLYWDMKDAFMHQTLAIDVVSEEDDRSERNATVKALGKKLGSAGLYNADRNWRNPSWKKLTTNPLYEAALRSREQYLAEAALI